MAYHLLAEPIRKFIYDKRWDGLRPIQEAAIKKILASDDNFILASRTASGKTEAAFLPILSKCDFNLPGIGVLYISPLVALINDQFYRIEELCKHLDVPVTKWHGESSQTAKQRILAEPGGIMLITPESLEAMFVTRPGSIQILFSHLQYVVIDEIHSFIGTDRGVQLKSMLSRLVVATNNSFSVVGLSATIGDYGEAKRFTGNESKTTVLLDRTPKNIKATFSYYEQTGKELPLEMLKDIYLKTRNNKTLLFPNTRAAAEEIAVRLTKIATLVKGHQHYFSHHASIDKESREYIEYFAKNNEHRNFCICCTSTLELGIDIGSVDQVIQVDATPGIASMIQRVGRSGRRDGEESNLFLYATEPWSLLQSLASWLLYRDGYIEPPASTGKAYDILVHQALAITKGHNGIPYKELLRQLKSNAAFSDIDETEIKEIVDHLIQSDLLEKLRHELIVGIEGEKLVNERDFYSVFQAAETFKVIHAGDVIGYISLSEFTGPGENILLAARAWTIKFIDAAARIVGVVPAQQAKAAMFPGSSGADVDPAIRKKMQQLLFSQEQFSFMSEEASRQLELLRTAFSQFDIHDTALERPLLDNKSQAVLFTFAGCKTNRALRFLLYKAGITSDLDDDESSFSMELSPVVLMKKWDKIVLPVAEREKYIKERLEANPGLLDFSKWGSYLPIHLQTKLMQDRYYDFEGAEQLIKSVKLVVNNE